MSTHLVLADPANGFSELTSGPKCFKASIYSDWSKKMKVTLTRDCTCGTPLRLPLDATEVLPPDMDEKEREKEIETAPKVKRKKFLRKPGEPLVLSSKMRWLHDELIRNSKRNPYSPYYNAFEAPDELEETDSDGKPFLTKSVIL